jgi:hypothetical protein
LRPYGYFNLFVENENGKHGNSKNLTF